MSGVMMSCGSDVIMLGASYSDAFSCPANSHYESCTRSCDLTCAGLSAAPSLCTKKCFEGCQCDVGYVSDGGTCAPMERCGCMHNGHYIQAEESLVSRDCSEKCTCHASGQLTCAKLSCKAGETCTLKNGVRGCVRQEAQCTLAVGGQLTSFDGASGEMLYAGAYEVASLCNSADLSWFRVIVDVKSCRDSEGMAGVAIYVFFRETFIAINKNKEAWVREPVLPYGSLQTEPVIQPGGACAKPLDALLTAFQNGLESAVTSC
ncbi:PREDICTED: IgGFc-binding protein-like [Gekko japonicus]|uniref:IgGFc-binding protein-like n=1 Tax=Gekko japonicus TaxID=146911 RepID=A0ABM1JW96_GEKJA|nr:PREDICTED: IgGFc-binding protein-like [Gekko japonicus]